MLILAGLPNDSVLCTWLFLTINPTVFSTPPVLILAGLRNVSALCTWLFYWHTVRQKQQLRDFTTHSFLHIHLFGKIPDRNNTRSRFILALGDSPTHLSTLSIPVRSLRQSTLALASFRRLATLLLIFRPSPFRYHFFGKAHSRTLHFGALLNFPFWRKAPRKNRSPKAHFGATLGSKRIAEGNTLAQGSSETRLTKGPFWRDASVQAHW